MIAPWNYPWSIPFGEVAIALMCGNGVVLKPASLTPLIGAADPVTCSSAPACPTGIVRAVHGGGAVGNALVESSAAKIFFTGSVEVGRRGGRGVRRAAEGLGARAGRQGPACSCWPTRNLDNAVAGCLWGGFANAGPDRARGSSACTWCASVADRFIDGRGGGRAGAAASGDPMSWDVEVGPMVSEDQFEIVRELVDDAVADGATLHCGGPAEVDGLSGRFYAPAVLTA